MQLPQRRKRLTRQLGGRYAPVDATVKKRGARLLHGGLSLESKGLSPEELLQLPGIFDSRTARGVIKYAPHVDRFGALSNERRKPREVVRFVARPVRSRSAMQTEVRDAVPTTGSA